MTSDGVTSDGVTSDGVTRLSPRHALAGVQASVLGVAAMLGCTALGSIVDGRSLWLVPNLFSSVFYGADGFQNQFLWTGLSGIALLVLVYGVIGIVWGCVWKDIRKPGLAFFGGVFGLGAWFLLSALLWKRVSPMIALYAPDRQLELGHILWGMALSKSPAYARRIVERSRLAPPAQVEVDVII